MAWRHFYLAFNWKNANNSYHLNGIQWIIILNATTLLFFEFQRLPRFLNGLKNFYAKGFTNTISTSSTSLANKSNKTQPLHHNNCWLPIGWHGGLLIINTAILNTSTFWENTNYGVQGSLSLGPVSHYRYHKEKWAPHKQQKISLSNLAPRRLNCLWTDAG